MGDLVKSVLRFYFSDIRFTAVFAAFCFLCLICLLLQRYGNRNFDSQRDRLRKQTHVGRKIIRGKENVSMALYERRVLLRHLAMVFYLLAMVAFVLNRGESVRGFRALSFRRTLSGKPGDMPVFVRDLVAFLMFIPYGALVRRLRVRTHWRRVVLQLLFTALLLAAVQFAAGRGEAALDEMAVSMLGGLLGVKLMRDYLNHH